jgi:hypothetical protein
VTSRSGDGAELTTPAALVICVYVGTILLLPFIADADPSFGVFLLIWVGGSCIAGAVIPRLWMFAIPVGVLGVLCAVLMLGYTNSEFLSDPLSIVALFALTVGEFVGLAAGYTAVSALRARR